MRYRTQTKFTDITASEAAEMRRTAKKCAECGERLGKVRHLDHIIPLKAPEEIAGTHTRDNVRVLCAPCNLSKGNRMDGLPAVQLNIFMVPDAHGIAVRPFISVNRVCVMCGLSSVPDSRAWHHDMHCYECKPYGSRRTGYRRRTANTYTGKHDMGTVVMLRRCGDGYKTIAKAIGVSRNTARELVKRAEKIGLVAA